MRVGEPDYQTLAYDLFWTFDSQWDAARYGPSDVYQAFAWLLEKIPIEHLPSPDEARGGVTED